jgi:hypothetical protein
MQEGSLANKHRMQGLQVQEKVGGACGVFTRKELVGKVGGWAGGGGEEAVERRVEERSGVEWSGEKEKRV